MKGSSPDGGADAEHSGVGFVEKSKILVTLDIFSFNAEPLTCHKTQLLWG